MTNEQILKTAIEKALRNGWSPYQGWTTFTMMDDLGWVEFRDGLVKHKTFDLFTIIFDHNFAKVFWGAAESAIDDENHCRHCGEKRSIQPDPSTGCSHIHYPEDCKTCRTTEMSWKDHLQEMVIADDPLKYLEQFLEGGL